MRLNFYTVAICLGVAEVVLLSSCDSPNSGGVSRRYSPLVGKPAPAFATVDQDGNDVDLAKHLGKDVIMLDFWATWCQPCIVSMPDITRIANKYKDRGLVFYAVNVGEDQDAVKEFLMQKNFNIPVAMDFQGKIQNAFEGVGLPYTVLIGKDGRVQATHLGYEPGMDSVIDEQVKALLAGKALVNGSVGP